MPVWTAKPPKPPPGPGPPGTFGPRRDWQLVLGPASGGYVLPVAHPQEISATWRLTDAHEVGFTVNAGAGYDTGIDPLATDVHLLYAGEPVMRARIGPTHDEWDGALHLASFTGWSYRALLDHRVLFSDSRLTYTSLDVAQICWDLIADTQARPGGDLGITAGAGNPAGTAATQTCEPGDVIGEVIDGLAGSDPGGFEWDITPAKGGGGLLLDLWPAGRGTPRGVIFQRGDELTGPAWSRDYDPSGYANALRVTGQAPSTGTNPQPPAPVEITAADIATRAEGRWDATLQADDTDAERLAARAALTLQATAEPVPSWTIPLRPGAWGGPDHIWIGDTVTIVPGTGRFAGVTETMRVLELSASVGPDVTGITLTLGAPARHMAHDLKRVFRELRKARRLRLTGKNPRASYTMTVPDLP